MHLATGHQQDDQAETLLQRLARGSGIDGMAAMATQAMMPFGRLIRPLLGLTRQRLQTHLDQHQIDALQDPSNGDHAYQRARARDALATLGGLLPTDDGAASHDNVPRLKARLAQSTHHLQQAIITLDQSLGALIAAAVAVSRCGTVTILSDPFFAATDDLQLRLLGRAIAAVGGNPYPPRFSKLVAARDALVTANGSEQAAPINLGGCLTSVTPPHIRVEREARHLPAPRPLTPQAVPTWDGRFRLTVHTSGRDSDKLSLTLAPVGETGRQQFSAAQGDRVTESAQVLRTQPAVWRGPELIGVPTLDWWREGTPLLTAQFAPPLPLSGRIGPLPQ